MRRGRPVRAKLSNDRIPFEDGPVLTEDAQSLLAGLLSPPLFDSGAGELGFESASAAFLYESLR